MCAHFLADWQFRKVPNIWSRCDNVAKYWGLFGIEGLPKMGAHFWIFLPFPPDFVWRRKIRKCHTHCNILCMHAKSCSTCAFIDHSIIIILISVHGCTHILIRIHSLQQHGHPVYLRACWCNHATCVCAFHLIWWIILIHYISLSTPHAHAVMSEIIMSLPDQMHTMPAPCANTMDTSQDANWLACY